MGHRSKKYICGFVTQDTMVKNYIDQLKYAAKS